MKNKVLPVCHQNYLAYLDAWHSKNELIFIFIVYRRVHYNNTLQYKLPLLKSKYSSKTVDEKK